MTTFKNLNQGLKAFDQFVRVHLSYYKTEIARVNWTNLRVIDFEEA